MNNIDITPLETNIYMRFVNYVYTETNQFPQDENFVKFELVFDSTGDYQIGIKNWNIDLVVPTKDVLLSYDSSQVLLNYTTFIKYYVKKMKSPVYNYQNILIPFQGPFEGPKMISVTIVQQGAIITLQTASVTTFGNNSSAKIVSTEPIPYLFQPSIDIIDSLIVKNNGINQIGTIKLTPNGFIEISADLSENPFSEGDGEYGSVSTTIQYLI